MQEAGTLSNSPAEFFFLLFRFCHVHGNKSFAKYLKMTWSCFIDKHFKRCWVIFKRKLINCDFSPHVFSRCTS